MGIECRSQIFFINALDPSNWEAYLFGPKTLILFFFKKSTNPFTKGSSGPTITKSILFDLIKFRSFLKFNISTLIFVANSKVPAFPGKHIIFSVLFDSKIFLHIACSLPPLPIIPIFMITFILYNLSMIKKKAKLLFKNNYFDILEEGDYVLCAVSGKEILLKDLNYWNVDLQEAYFSAKEANEKFVSLKK